MGVGGGRPTMSLDAFDVLFFDSVREANNGINTFLNLRFIKKQEAAAFFEKLYANKLKVKKVSLNVPQLLIFEAKIAYMRLQNL